MTDPHFDADDYNDISENEISAPALHITIPLSMGGKRLDVALAHLLPTYSRSRLQRWIKEGAVTVDKNQATSKCKLFGGEDVIVVIQETQENLAFQPEPMSLPIVFEDEHILVINKPAGLVVHPATGNWSGTLLNALLHYYPPLAQIPRAGIVHRLDKDTSGLMIVAKTVLAQTDLVRQLQARSVKRIYRAIVNGVVPFDGTISASIGRDPHNRLRMAVVEFGGKPAITHLRVLQRFVSHSYVECRLETGRTHQIRAHMRASHHPLAGDPLYGNSRHKMPVHIATAVKTLGRQALHAYRLSLKHPMMEKQLTWTAPLPTDIHHLLILLRAQHTDVPPSSPLSDGSTVWDDDAQ